MNAGNVIPYGNFVHEVAQYGGVAAYKASQKTLLNIVKEKSFHDGVIAGKQELFPWLIVTGTIALCSSIYAGYRLVNDYIDDNQLTRDAKDTEHFLTERSFHKDIFKEIQEDDKENL